MAEVRLISDEEAKGLEKAKLVSIDDESVKVLNLPPSCSSGHGWCENGLCFVCCGGTWYRLVDQNNNQYTCDAGRTCTYQCSGSTYAATC